MSLIRGRDTKPERLVGAMLRGLGLGRGVVRGQRKVAGVRVDFAVRGGGGGGEGGRRGVAVLVHGCFWHVHGAAGCPTGKRRRPATRAKYWAAKLAGNRRRDPRVARRLRGAGWRVVTVWECALRNAPARERVRRRLARVLGTETRS